MFYTVIRDRGSDAPASDNTLNFQPFHQPFHRAASHLYLLPVQLSPDLARSVDPEVFLPLNVEAQNLVAPSPGWKAVGISFSRLVLIVG